MRIIDMAESPGFNPSTNSGRGDWSLHDVSTGQVALDDWWQKPECIDHGAMNCVAKDLTIWRCIECGRGAFDMDRYTPTRLFDIWSEGYAANEGRFGAILLDSIEAKTFDEAVEQYVRKSPEDRNLIKQDESGQWRFWGCKLYDNETEARAFFG